MSQEVLFCFGDKICHTATINSYLNVSLFTTLRSKEQMLEKLYPDYLAVVDLQRVELLGILCEGF